jgi:hypothetical protein
MKQAAKRVGRKPLLTADRYEKSGKVKNESLESIRRTATEARVRVFGMDPAAAVLPEAGHAVGRLLLEGRLGLKQQAADLKQAALDFHERRAAADRAYLSRPLTTSTNYVDGKGGFDGTNGDDAGYVKKCKAAIAAYHAVQSAVLSCGDTGALAALEHVVIDDREPTGEAMLGSLRCGLNAVHQALRFSKRGA